MVYFAVFFEVVGKAKQQYFALFLEEYRASFEEDVGFDFGAFFKEAYGVAQLEVVVVVVCLRSESYFFDNDFGCLGFNLFLLFLLLVQVFLIVKYLAYRRLGSRGYFHEIQLEFFGLTQGVVNGVYARCDVITYETYFACTNLFVDEVGICGLFAATRHWGTGARGARRPWAGMIGFFLHSVGVDVVYYVYIVRVKGFAEL